jgi:hypothetical protein
LDAGKDNWLSAHKGRFYTDNDKRPTYLGVGYIAGEKPEAYSAGPDNDQVGHAYRTGKNESNFPPLLASPSWTSFKLRR